MAHDDRLRAGHVVDGREDVVAGGGEIEWNEGMLYPVLHRLEAEGLIRSRWREAESGRRRKYYQLSAAGKRSLVVHREQWNSVHRALTHLWGAAHV